MKPFYRLTRAVLYGYFTLLYHHKTYGEERLPKGAAILAANHASFLDPPLMAMSTSEEAHFLARGSLFNNRFLKLLIANLNAYPVTGTSQNLKSFKMVTSLLKENKKVVIFPEGYRTEDNTFSELKTGVAMLAIRCSCPIVPVYIHGTFPIWPRQKKFPKLHGQTACVFGEPIYADSSLTDKKKQQDELTQRLEKSLVDLREWYDSQASVSPE